MAYTSSAVAPHSLAFTQSSERTQRPGLSLWRRLFGAMMLARQHEAERAVARYLAETGGKFTDEVEREIERRFLSGSARW